MSKEELIENFAERISRWLKENELELTMENIRRYYALKFPRNVPDEKIVKQIYSRIQNSKKKSLTLEGFI